MSLWFLTAVFAATLVMSAQTLWWMWHEPVEITSRSTWDLMHVFSSFFGREPRVRWPLTIGGLAVLGIFGGVALRRRWGVAMTLPCSMALISVALCARYLALSGEPKQFISRSIYVQGATRVLFVVLLTHGVAALLALRLLRRQSDTATAPLRVSMGALCLLLSLVPALAIQDGMRGTAGMEAWIYSQLVVIAATIAMIAWLRRATLRIALAAIGLAVIAQGLSLAIHLNEKPRRHHLYSEHAETSLLTTSLALPALLALLGLVLIIQRHMKTSQPAPTADP